MSIIHSQETKDILSYYEDLTEIIDKVRGQVMALDNKLVEVTHINPLDHSFQAAQHDIRHSLRKAVAELDMAHKAAAEYAEFSRQQKEESI